MRAARGFSLAEVVVALGLLAGVLISVAGLLVLGNRQVSSGRNSSEALAVARDVLEEIKGWGFRHTYELFEPECDASQTSCTVDSRDSAHASPWQQRLDAELQQARLEIRLDAIDEGGPALDEARGIRVTVSVFWAEGLRPRRVSLATARL